MTRFFPDSKTVVDCVPKFDPDEILARYRQQCSLPDFNLRHFVATHFDPPEVHASHYLADANQTIIEARSTESPDDIFDRILNVAWPSRP